MEESHTRHLPSNIENVPMTVMKNYSKTQIRMLGSTTSALHAGDSITFHLPAAKIVDLASLRFSMNISTEAVDSADATHMVGLPKYTSSLIDQMEITCNGISVQNIQRYNMIYNIVKDYSCDYEKLQQKLFNNADPSVDYTLAANGDFTKYSTYGNSGVVAVNSFRKLYTIDDFIGFLDFSKGDRTSFFSTNLVGDFEIRYTFAPNSVLWTQAANAPASPAYTITNMVGYIDAIEFKDSAYVDALEKKMTSIDPGTGERTLHLMPYKNYKSYTGTTTGNNGLTTMRVVENTSSLDKIIFTYIPTNFNTISTLQLGNQAEILPAAAPTIAQVQAGSIPPILFNYEYLKATKNPHLLNSSRYFRRTGLALGYNPERTSTGQIQFELDSQDLHNPMDMASVYQETLKAFELDHNNINKCNVGIRHFNTWLSDFFVSAYSVSHVGGKTKGVLVSGVDTMSTAVNVAVKVLRSVRGLNNVHAAIPLLITECTSILKIGQGRAVAVQP